MANYREILRLYSLGTSQRSIAREVQSSRDTVADVIKAAEAAGIAWPLDDDVTNGDIQEILFPGKYVYASPYTVPDYQWIHTELAKKGVTLTLLWDEYCQKVRSTGGVPYMYTQFCEKYRRWARLTKATMRITHKPGDAMQVDWAGDPLYITDSVTGELTPVYIFVAVLPCSWYTYAEACDDMKMENWLLCHVHAYNYFGGVTRILTPDNLKTGVIKNTRTETVLNKAYQEMAEHYGTAIIPTRPRTPKDKAFVEGSVGVVSTWILAALRNRQFLSLDELNHAIWENLVDFNHKPFQKKDGGRASDFEEEKLFLLPLPPNPFELAEWKTATVQYNYHISVDRMNYSVPYE